MKWHLIMILICISLITNNVIEHRFNSYGPYVYLYEVLFKIFVHLYWVIFYYWFVGVFYICTIIKYNVSISSQSVS